MQSIKPNAIVNKTPLKEHPSNHLQIDISQSEHKQKSNFLVGNNVYNTVDAGDGKGNNNHASTFCNTSMGVKLLSDYF